MSQLYRWHVFGTVRVVLLVKVRVVPPVNVATVLLVKYTLESQGTVSIVRYQNTLYNEQNTLLHKF